MLTFNIGDEVYFDSPPIYENLFTKGKEFYYHYRGYITNIDFPYVQTVYADDENGPAIKLSEIQGKYFIVKKSEFNPFVGKYLERDEEGKAFGVANLDSRGKVPLSQIDLGALDNIEIGYYYNGSFYKDSEHLVVIEPREEALYIDKTTNPASLYVYNGTQYEKVGDIGNVYTKAQADARFAKLEGSITYIEN